MTYVNISFSIMIIIIFIIKQYEKNLTYTIYMRKVRVTAVGVSFPKYTNTCQ